MEQPLTYKGVELIWDEIAKAGDAQPVFFISPWAAKAIKRVQKQFGRRDRRRKHKRYERQ